MIALSRRDLGLAALGALAGQGLLVRPSSALAVPGTNVACRVIRGSSPIGAANYQFDRGADGLTVHIDVELSVRIGFITVFRYSHQNTEIWRGDQQVAFSARTNRNGAVSYAAANFNGHALLVSGSAVKPYAAPKNAIGTSFWSVKTLTSPLIHTENGRLLKENVTLAGPSEAVLSNGAKVNADEYRLAGDLRINLWFDSAKNWTGMQYFAHDGSILTYEKI